MAERYDSDLDRLATLIAQGTALDRDRTAAIACASFVERNLDDILATYFPGMNDKIKQKPFSPRGALQTLGAKIDLAEALGAAPPETAENLRLIAKIRNKFAHDLNVETFDDAQVAGLVDKLEHDWDSGPLATAREDRGSRFRQMAIYIGVVVRRQNIWRRSRRRLAECGPRLGVDVRRRACGVASADVRWSFA